jgi:hypothetical protein
VYTSAQGSYAETMRFSDASVKRPPATRGRSRNKRVLLPYRRRRAGAVWACLAVASLLLFAFGSSASASTPEATPITVPPNIPAPTPTPTPTPSTPSTPPTGEVQLSNETTLTTWAHPEEVQRIYAAPEIHAHVVGHVHMETEDGFPEVYLLLSMSTDANGEEWVHLRIPARPNGRTGWVQRSALGSFQVTHWQVVIDLHKRLLSAYYSGHRRFTAPVGVGKPSTPTPPGRFWIRERFRITDRSSPYWPYALGTSDYSTLTDWPGGGVVGIHGDFGEPQFIPGDPSHGCVRMLAPELTWLATHVTIGTPVYIVE